MSEGGWAQRRGRFCMAAYGERCTRSTLLGPRAPTHLQGVPPAELSCCQRLRMGSKNKRNKRRTPSPSSSDSSTDSEARRLAAKAARKAACKAAKAAAEQAAGTAGAAETGSASKKRGPAAEGNGAAGAGSAAAGGAAKRAKPGAGGEQAPADMDAKVFKIIRCVRVPAAGAPCCCCPFFLRDMITRRL